MPRLTKRYTGWNGFTLIELLVVIAIIGILSTTVLISLGGARDKARDARRQSDIYQFVTAMELDYSENGQYSASDSMPAKMPCRVNPPTCTGANDGAFMDPVPSDPGGGSYQWLDNLPPTSFANCDSQSFTVYAQLTTGTYFAGSPRGTQETDEEPEACP